jgi:Nitrile hydratase beta subunit
MSVPVPSRECYYCFGQHCERCLHKIAMRSHHDMGGLPAGHVQATEHDYALWEKRVDALMVLLSAAGRMTVDELRRNIEAIGPDAYDRMTYYERWIHSISQTLIQRGVISIEELGRKMAQVEARHQDECR